MIFSGKEERAIQFYIETSGEVLMLTRYPDVTTRSKVTHLITKRDIEDVVADYDDHLKQQSRERSRLRREELRAKHS